MKRWTSMAAALAICYTAAFAGELRPPVSDRIRAAVARASGTSARGVELLTTPKTTATELRLVSMQRDHITGLLKVRLECLPRATCVPFYALIHGSMPTATTGISTSAQRNRVLIRAGEKARLHIDTGRLRLSTQVTCLQSGAAGSKIRVRDTATNRISIAQVVDRGLVRVIVQ